MCHRKSLVVFSLLFVILAVCSLAIAEAVFAFPMATYDVMVSKQVKLEPILQGAEMPEGAVYRWSSSDESIAKVQKGKVTGRKAGKATITCAIAQKDEVLYETSCEVVVNQPVKQIKVEEKQIKVGQYDKGYQLVTTVLPEDATNKELIYTTSKGDIATVSSTGFIKGQDNGKCNITIEAADGSGIKQTVQVTVLPVVIRREELIIDHPAAYRLKLNYPTYFTLGLTFGYKRTRSR